MQYQNTRDNSQFTHNSMTIDGVINKAKIVLFYCVHQNIHQNSIRLNVQSLIHTQGKTVCKQQSYSTGYTSLELTCWNRHQYSKFRVQF